MKRKIVQMQLYSFESIYELILLRHTSFHYMGIITFQFVTYTWLARL